MSNSILGRLTLAAPRQAVFWGFGFWVAGALAAGSAARGVTPVSWGLLGLVLLAACSAWLGRKRFFVFVALLCFVLGAFFEAVSFKSFGQISEDWVQTVKSKDSLLECTVTGRYRESAEGYSGRFVCSDLAWAVTGRGSQKLPGALTVSVPRDPANFERIRYGVRVRSRGALAPIKTPTNPAEWDERAWRRTDGVWARFKAKQVERAGDAPGFAARVGRLRARLIDQIRRTHRPAAATLVEALILGETEKLDQSFKRALAATGTFHLFAVSGFQVSAVFGAVFWILGRSPLRRLRWIAALAAVGGYAMLAGMGSPVLRAVWMAVFFALAAIRGRDPVPLNALGGAGLAILITRPEEMGDRGFALSFASVFAIVVIGRRLLGIADLRDARSDRWFARGRAVVSVLWKTSFAAWLGTLPLVAVFFGGIPLLAPFWNVWAVPLFGVISAVVWASFLWSFLPRVGGWAAWIAWPAEALGGLFERSIFWTGETGLGVWSFAPPPVWVWGVFAAGAAFALGSSAFKTAPRRMFAAAAIGILPLLLWDIRWNAGRDTRVTFFDIGQGDAAFIEASNGTLLIDTGPPGSAFRVIAPYLKSRGVGRIDAILVTHPQRDHAGDLDALVEAGFVRRIFHNGDLTSKEPYRSDLRQAESSGILVRPLRRLERVAGLSGVECEVLGPDPRAGLADENDRSLVVALRFGGSEFVLTGDAGDDALRMIEPPQSPPDTKRVYKIPHHGAKAGPEGVYWLERYRPNFAVFSVGRENRYGHPNPVTLEAAAAFSGRVLRTDRDGAIQFFLSRDGRIRRVRTWASGQK